MAILIDNSVNLFGGVNVPQLYIRLRLDLTSDGAKVITRLEAYDSKDSYDENKTANKIPFKPHILALNYDRSIDGSDLLMAIHEKVKSYLSTDAYEPQAVVDPSTGEYERDPSTNEIVFENVLTRPKTADEADISFVDID